MSDENKQAELDEWKRIVLIYARTFAEREGRDWFSGLNVLTNYTNALQEFQSTGDVRGDVGRLVSNLPKDADGMLDTDKLDRICDLLIADGLLESRPGRMYKDAKAITPKGRAHLALHELSVDAKPAPTEAAGAEPRIVIITIRDDEYQSVRRRFDRATIHEGKHQLYAHATIRNAASGRLLSIYLARQDEQGPTAGQDTARDAIEDLDPHLIVISGIAGAVPSDDFTLGDVVVATRLHDFVVGAATEGGTFAVADQGGPTAKRLKKLISMLPELSDGSMKGWNDAGAFSADRPGLTMADIKTYGDAKWQEKVTRSLKHHFVDHPRAYPIATGRAIASSGTLVKDSELLKRWLSSSREICAIEMELSGVYAAAQRVNRTYPVLAIRGISDVVGLERDARWTAYACETAAALCVAILKHAPLRSLAGPGAGGTPQDSTIPAA